MKARRTALRGLAVTLLGVGTGRGAPLAICEIPAPTPTPPITAFAVFSLSRGKGVPTEARDALLRVAAIADADKRRGVRVVARRTRIGLEGETRLCLEYQSPADARRALDEAEKVVKDVDLVRLVPGPCAEKAKPDEKEVKP